jgi:glucose-6-phosphate 1-dehydrogenase
VTHPENHVIVIFGATGDLAKRKLLPGLFHLAAAGLMPERYRIIGSSPASSSMSDIEFRQHAKDAAEQFGTTKPTGPAWDAFEVNLSFGAADPGAMGPLNAAVHAAEDAIGGEPRRLFHLAVPPVAFPSVIGELGQSGLATPESRVIIEKPFGEDLASAQALNAEVHKVFTEDQIFRIDHFLGKESVDNILAFRFANGLFEPVWNRNYLRYVQIDVPETLSIEGRAAFYDATGAYRDMVVTHLFQVLGFVAMEPPTSLAPGPLRNEKTEVFDALKPIDVRHVVRGQYEGYLSEAGVPANSDTETMVAVRAQVDNWRWHGVPFFLRSGKAMAQSRQVVTLGFHEPVMRMFHIHQEKGPSSRANEIVIDFADPGSITIHFLTKEPGAEITMEPACMTFSYANSYNEQNALEGYERLIMDAMLGNQALFTNAAGIERVWEISEPLLQSPPPVKPYKKGSWGPPEVNDLIAPFHWHLS